MDVGSSIPNGLNNEMNDAASLYGANKSGAAPNAWINVGVGVNGQSTLSRKSGKEIID